MNRPQQQNNFLPVRADYTPPPPHIDLRGDIIRAGDERLADALRFGDPAETYGGADPLPVPPGCRDTDLPDTGPVSPTMRAASWRTGQAHVDAIGSGTYAQFMAKRARLVDGKRGPFPLVPAVPVPDTRYVEGLAHTEAPPVPTGHAERPFGGPAGVPDGYGPRPAPRVLSLEADPEAIDAANRAEFGGWLTEIIDDAKFLLALLVFAAVIAAAAVWPR